LDGSIDPVDAAGTTLVGGWLLLEVEPPELVFVVLPASDGLLWVLPV